MLRSVVGELMSRIGSVRRRTTDDFDDLRAVPLTYAHVGATATSLPSGYRRVSETRVLRRRDFDNAARELMSWQVHRWAGLGVRASSSQAASGVVVVMRLGIGRLSVRIPCRVIYQVSEPDRVGFAYGTLPGHPESGEELFLLRLVFTITAFSRPHSALARLGGPVTTRVQDVMTRRYLDALDRPG